MISALFFQYLHVFGRLGLLALYLVLHLCAGLVLPYRRGAKPYFFMLVEYTGLDLERRLNRESRAQPARLARGAVVALVFGFIAAFAGYLGQRFGWAAEFVLLALCINFMTPLKLLRRVVRHLQHKELSQAADELQPHLNAPLDRNDSHALIRKALEFIALSLNQHLAGPVFWFLAAGPVGLLLYVTYAALNQAFGLADERRKYFGRCVRGLDTLLNVVPSLLTAFMLCVSALFVSKSNPLRAVSTLLRQGYPYSGWPIAALAGGLGVTLGGSVRHSADYTEERAWIGPEGSSARLEVGDLERASLLQYVFFICTIGILSILMILKI